MSFCATCNLKLEERNKTGYCTSHKSNWRKKCSSCEELIYAGSKSGLCKKCYYVDFYSKNKNTINKHYNEVYHKNKQAINKKRAQREKVRWHSDFDFKLKKTLRSRFKKAMRENWVKGSFTKSLGCSIPEFKKYIETRFESGMSWDNYGKEWQIDHIVAFCSIDLTNNDQLLKVSHYTNLQPIWNENHYKKTSLDKEKYVIL